jgi:hypothetical protein
MRLRKIRRLAALGAFVMLAVTAFTPAPASAHAGETPYFGGAQPLCVYIYTPHSYGQDAQFLNPLNKSGSANTVQLAINVINAQPSRYTFQWCGFTYSNDGYDKVVLSYNPLHASDGGLAVAYKYTTQDGQYVIGSKIEFNDSVLHCVPTPATCALYYWRVDLQYTNGTARWNDFQYVLTHELLHVWRAPHVTNSYHTMLATSTWARNSTMGRTLETHDVDWINTQQ